MHENLKKSNFDDRTLKTVGKGYVLVWKAEVKPWQAWLLIGLAAGLTASLAFVASRSGEVKSSAAAVGGPIDAEGQSITVLAPNGSEEFERGATTTIRWSSTGNIPIIDIYFFRPEDFVRCERGGSCPVDNKGRYYIAHNIRNTGSFEWKVANVAPGGGGQAPRDGEYLMRVVKPDKFLVVDDSDAPFAITSPGQPPGGGTGSGRSITIISPNGGELWEAGSVQTIKWDSTPDVDRVLIYAYKPEDKKPCPHPDEFCDIDLKLTHIIARDLQNTGYFKWIVPHTIEGGDYMIRVRKSSAFRIADDSDDVVTIGTRADDGGHGMNPALGQFSCTDVRIGQSNAVNPKTGEYATQVESRKMVELRQFDCFWRAYRYAKRMYEETTSTTTQAAIKAKLDSALMWQAKAVFRTIRDSQRAVDHRSSSGTWFISRDAYVWIYPPNGFVNIRQALQMNPGWVQAHPDDALLQMIGAKLEAGKIVEFVYPPTPPLKKLDFRNKRVGLVRGGMKFEPLTAKQLEMLDEVKTLHTRWATAALAKDDESVLQPIVIEHHNGHMALESMARTTNEQIFLTIPEHGKHVICWSGRSEELTKRLIAETDRLHQLWVHAVKQGRFTGTDGSWATGIKHSRAHVLLGTCGVGQPKLGDKEIGDRFSEIRRPPELGDPEL